MQRHGSRITTLSRRQFLNVSAAATVTLAAPNIASSAQNAPLSGKTVRVLTWADATGQAAVRRIMKPFEAATGARVIADLTGTTSEMVAKIKASAARPQHDIVILSGFGAAELAAAGLLEKPDLGKLSNMSSVLPQYQSGADGFGVGYFLWSDGLVYNTQTFSAAPASYDVLWDDKHSGRIFLPPPNTLMAMEMVIVAAKAAGGSQTSPDKGFELLKKLKSRTLTISSNAGQLSELFRAGSLDCGGVYSPLEMAAFIPRQEFQVSGTYDLAEGFFTDLQLMVVPKGHPGDATAIHEFLNFTLDRDVQARMAEDVWYGPINKDAPLSELALASPYIASPSVIEKRAIKIDTNHLAGVRTDWTKRYTEAVAA
jgi:putative spermidine/putrescine transport system substrate-binding protein